MDGVPVKISDKYKRPRSKELPYNITECASRARSVVESVSYCSTFEKNVLAKLQELRSAKETKKTEWRHRLQLLQEAKQKKLDAIAAAEAEEKLKQLSVSEVSYPSTDEISALSLDDKAEQTCEATSKQESPEVSEPTIPTTIDVTYPSCCNSQETQANILQPIQVQAKYPQNSLLDDPDPLQELKMSTKITRIPQYGNIDMLTYKDFENDTSSPFDNVELKTINDMELLAQVLQSQRDSGTSCPQNYVPEAYPNMPNCASQAQVGGMSYLPNSYMEQPIQGQSVMYLPQHYPVPNGYYVPAENTCDNPMPMDNINMYMPNYQYYVPTNAYPNVDPTFYNTPLPTTSAEVNPLPNGSTYIPQPYYFQVPQIPYSADNTTYSTPQEQNPQNFESQNPSNNSQNTMKSRSRSVPDIVRELNEELASAKLRSNERSCTTSPAPKNIPRTTSGGDKKEEKKSRKKERLPNPYEKLPPAIQNMCQKIHGMGFPLDRVARVCGLLGDNDKKVRNYHNCQLNQYLGLHLKTCR